jgi:hypothetical protein
MAKDKTIYGLPKVRAEDVDPAKHIILEGEFTLVHDGLGEKPLGYEPNGKGGVRFVYPDKPASKGRTFTC